MRRPTDPIKKNTLMPVVQYFTLLYGDQQFVWANDYLLQKHRAITKEQAIAQFTDVSFDNGAFVAINPAIEEGINKTSENVAVLRNFLIEFDKLPLDEQIPFMESTKIPWSACVFSAGKSYHFIISLKEPINGLLQYKDVFYRLHFLCQEKNDRACSDPGRFTRFPNALRGSSIQKIVSIRDRVDNRDLFDLIYSADFEESYKKTKWYQIFQKNAVSSDNPSDRQGVVKKLKWYVTEHLGLSIELGGKLAVACPCCRDEGGDNHGDNLHITGQDALFHCFKDPDMHNDKILTTIDKLMQESGATSKKPEYSIEKSNNLINWESL